MNKEYDGLFGAAICVSVLGSIIFGIYLIVEVESLIGIIMIVFGVPSLVWNIKHFLLSKRPEFCECGWDSTICCGYCNEIVCADCGGMRDKNGGLGIAVILTSFGMLIGVLTILVGLGIGLVLLFTHPFGVEFVIDKDGIEELWENKTAI